VYQYNAAKAAVPSVEAQLAAAEKNLSYCDIYSPINGVVMMRNVSMGQTVASSFNTPTLFIIAKDITKMQVQAAVDEADIGTVALGQHAVFTVDAFPEDEFSGIVGQIRLQPIVSANVVTYTTIIKAANDEMKLKPGMTANIFIYIKEDSNALLIPATALKFNPDPTLGKQYVIQPLAETNDYKHDSSGKKNNAAGNSHKTTAKSKKEEFGAPATVWVMVNNQLIQKLIHTGITDDTHVQVLDGLTVNDEIVVPAKAGSTKSATTKVERSPFMPARRNTTPAKRPTRPNP
jgi:HlyD family secretion protein